MEDRRILIADTAIAVISETGIRGLTHRAVDAAADLATGSTSYYARSKAQLVALTVERLASLLRGYTEHFDLAGERPGSGAALVEVLGRWLDGLFPDYRGEVRARASLILELERSDGPDADMLRDALLTAADLAGPVAAAGLADDAVAPLLTACEGVLWEHVAGRRRAADGDGVDTALLSAVVSAYDDAHAERRGGLFHLRR